jgi:hypothetical protein
MSEHTNWQRMTPAPPHTACSPNLNHLRQYLMRQAGGQFLGCYSHRPIRGGTSWSSHAFGAAFDWGYGARHNGPGRDVAMSVVVPWLIANATILGVQQIHDYGGARYWQNYRGWVLRAPGQGPSDSLHIETNISQWPIDVPVANRKVVTLELEQPPQPAAPKYPGRAIKLGSTGANVKRIQQRLTELKYATGPIDGRFGPITDKAVRQFQTKSAPPVDGIVGPITWRALFA